MISFLTYFPIFLSLGMRIDFLLMLFFDYEFLASLFVGYYTIILFFVLINLINLNFLLRLFYGTSIKPYRSFLLVTISFGLYIPYLILEICEKTKIFDKKLIYFSYFLPFISFFLFCSRVYSKILQKA